MNRNDLVVHQQVNQFFYMQKAEELKMLLNQFDDLRKSLESLTCRIDESYSLCFAQWRKDVRWLKTYAQNRERVRPVL